MLRSSAMANLPTTPTPQFATADYAGSGETCKSCKQNISGSYYRVNGSLACDHCTTQLKNSLPKDTHPAFVRAVIFGIGASVVGLIGYAAFGIITGIEIGYISLAVGWLIGKAMHKGSNGIGGRRYQIVAALLTYAAVSIAAIPIYLYQTKEHKPAPPAHVQTTPSKPEATGDADSDANSSNTSAAPAAKPKMGFLAAIGALTLLGLASPFLELADPVHGAIGLVILFVGIRFAWRQTGAPKIDILGPFQAKPPSPSPAT